MAALKTTCHSAFVLTPREIEILKMLGRGWTCKRIACYFGVKVTILRSTHIYNLLQKTGAKNQTQLAIYAHLHGYASIDLIDFGVGSLIGGQ